MVRRLSQFSKIVPIKTAYLRYAVCGCGLCIKNANCYKNHEKLAKIVRVLPAFINICPILCVSLPLSECLWCHMISTLEKTSYHRSTRIKASDRNDILDNLIQYNDQNFSQKLTLNSVAEHFFVSPSTISHICSDRLQASFYQFVQQRCLAEGRRLILNGLSMEAVAA